MVHLAPGKGQGSVGSPASLGKGGWVGHCRYRTIPTAPSPAVTL